MTTDNLTELTLVKAKQMHKELQEKIRADEFELQEIKKEAAREKARIELELAKYKEEADAIIAGINKTAEIPSNAINFVHGEHKMYRFGLNSCYSGNSHFMELSCETDDGLKMVYLMPNDSILDIDVDVSEIAEDLDERMSWMNNFSRNATLANVDVTFECSKPHIIRKQLDCGILEYGAIKDSCVSDSVVEMFVHGSAMEGILMIERIESIADNTLKYDWVGSFSGSHTNPIPYVLSYASFDNDFSIDYNLSCLPRRIKKHVPSDRQYWNLKENSERNVTRRTLINDMSKGKVYMPLADIPNGKFTVLKEWVPREEEKYHLIIEGLATLQLKSGTNFTEFSMPRVEFLFETSDVEVSLEDCKAGILTLSDEGPRFANAVDWGNCIIFENTDHHKVIKFMGAKMKDVFQLELGDDHRWKTNVLEVNRRSGHDLSNEQIDMIIELTKAKKERGVIAEAVGCSDRTVYQYQKVLGYV